MRIAKHMVSSCLHHPRLPEQRARLLQARGMTDEDAWNKLKLDEWVGRIQSYMLDIKAEEAKEKAMAKAKTQHKAEAKAQPKAKATAKGKALPKAQPKAMLKTVAKAQGKATLQAKATAKAKAALQVMAWPCAPTAPGSPCSNSLSATTLLPGGFLLVPDSPDL